MSNSRCKNVLQFGTADESGFLQSCLCNNLDSYTKAPVSQALLREINGWRPHAVDIFLKLLERSQVAPISFTWTLGFKQGAALKWFPRISGKGARSLPGRWMAH